MADVAPQGVQLPDHVPDQTPARSALPTPAAPAVSASPVAVALADSVHVAICYAPGAVHEQIVTLSMPTTVVQVLQAARHALQAESVAADTVLVLTAMDAALAGACPVGVWGRVARLDSPVAPQERVETYRVLLVDPKVARRQRFARQGARTTGLFARKRPGGKSGY